MTLTTTGVDDIPDDILRNILSRLPVKPMAGRCRCVSKRWNALISGPNFMMSRSPRIFLASIDYMTDRSGIHIFDQSRESLTDLDSASMFKLPSLEYQFVRRFKVVGTCRGIILLVVTDTHECIRRPMDEHMILYNPLTGVYDILDDPYPPFYYGRHAYGFGYGATTPDELKIVRFRTHRSKKVCDVFNLKTRSCSQLSDLDAHFQDPFIGTFLKGYLYWANPSKIMALDVDKMVFSDMHLPDSAIKKHNQLGTCHGCLWMITITVDQTHNFDVWVMNIEKGVDKSWSKTCSLAIGLEHEIYISRPRIIEITEEGRIIIYVNVDHEPHMIIHDTSKHSYKLLESTPSMDAHSGIKYKESLVSPMNICRV